jgi:hypothetical protein
MASETLGRRAYSPREWADTHGLGLDNVYQAIRDRKLIARKFGKRTIITEADGDKFLASLPQLELPENCPLFGRSENKGPKEAA